MSLSLQTTFLSIPFQQNGFASAGAGTLIFGNVTLVGGRLEYNEEESFVVNYHKLTEFVEILQVLGRNIVIAEDNDGVPSEKKIELCYGVEMDIVSTTLRRISTNRTEGAENVTFSLKFNHFSYINLITSLQQVCYFIINPTKEQYSAMRRFEESPLETDKEKIISASKKENMTADEIFLLESFLCIHLELMKFCIELNKLA